MLFTSPIRKQDWRVLYKYKKIRCTTVISHANGNKLDNFNKSSSDNVQKDSIFNTIITSQKLIYKKSSVSINNKKRVRTVQVKKFHLVKIQQK